MEQTISENLVSEIEGIGLIFSPMYNGHGELTLGKLRVTERKKNPLDRDDHQKKKKRLP